MLLITFLTIYLLPVVAMSSDSPPASCTQCENSSTCRLVTVNHVSSFVCQCQQGWVGSTCGIRIWLSMVNVTSETATIEIHVNGTGFERLYAGMDRELAKADQKVYISRDIEPGSVLTDDGTDKLGSNQKGSDLDDENLNDSTKTPLPTPNSSNNNSDILKALVNETDINLSIHYWFKQRPKVCNIVTNVSQSYISLFRLQSNSEYRFCVFTSNHDLCLPRITEWSRISKQSRTSKRAPITKGSRITEQSSGDGRRNFANCVDLKTKKLPDSGPDKIVMYTIVVASIAVIFLICLIVIVVISIQEKVFQQLICAKIRSKVPKRSRKTQDKFTISPIQMAKLDTENQSIELENLRFDSTAETTLLSSPTCPRIEVHPPRSPGKPNHQLVKERVKGYAVFSAKNEQTIPLSAVLEYDEADDTL